MTTDIFSLEGRTALVTGGSRGIGKMIAAASSSSGAKVYISSRKAADCDATAAELSKDGGTCISLPQDISTVEGCKALAARIGEPSRRSTSWSTTPAPPGARSSTTSRRAAGTRC